MWIAVTLGACGFGARHMRQNKINASTNKIYMVRLGNNDEATVIDGANHNWYSIALDSYTPMWASLNPSTNRLFVVGYTTGDTCDATENHPLERKTPAGAAACELEYQLHCLLLRIRPCPPRRAMLAVRRSRHR